MRRLPCAGEFRRGLPEERHRLGGAVGGGDAGGLHAGPVDQEGGGAGQGAREGGGRRQGKGGGGGGDGGGGLIPSGEAERVEGGVAGQRGEGFKGERALAARADVFDRDPGGKIDPPGIGFQEQRDGHGGGGGKAGAIADVGEERGQMGGLGRGAEEAFVGIGGKGFGQHMQRADKGAGDLGRGVRQGAVYCAISRSA